MDPIYPVMTVTAAERDELIQKRVLRTLELHQGEMALRELKKEIHAERFGTKVLKHVFQEMVDHGTIAYRDAVIGADVKAEDQRPAMVYLLKMPTAKDGE